MAGSNLIVLALFIVLVGASMVRSQADEWHSDGYGVGTEKITRLHFYQHYYSNYSMVEKHTVVNIAEAPTTNASPTSFGLLAITDNLLTEGSEPTSKHLGQAQGVLAAAALDEFTMVMATSFVFKGGDFSGSSLSVLGRNPFITKIREMPIVGGTGVFRFARGFVVVKTHYQNFNTHDLIEEYHMTVMHY